MYTNSLFLSVWCFFLVQALFVVLPVDLKSAFQKSSKKDSTDKPLTDDTFENAYHSAKVALRQLTTQR